MTDDAPQPVASANPATPIVINPSTVQAFLLMSLRIGGIVAGAFGVAASAFKTHDISAVVAWVQGNSIAELSSGIVFIGSFGLAAVITVRKKLREVYLAWHVDGAKAVISKPIEEPKAV